MGLKLEQGLPTKKCWFPCGSPQRVPPKRRRASLRFSHQTPSPVFRTPALEFSGNPKGGGGGGRRQPLGFPSSALELGVAAGLGAPVALPGKRGSTSPQTIWSLCLIALGAMGVFTLIWFSSSSPPPPPFYLFGLHKGDCSRPGNCPSPAWIQRETKEN